MNKIEEIKKEFEDKFDVLWKEYELEKYDGTKQTGTISVTEDVWNFLEQAITKSNEEAVRGFAKWLDISYEGVTGKTDNNRLDAEQYLTQKEEDEDNKKHI